MTIVEQYWFHKIFADEDVVPAYDSPDDPDTEFNDLHERAPGRGGAKLPRGLCEVARHRRRK